MGTPTLEVMILKELVPSTSLTIPKEGTNPYIDDETHFFSIYD